MKKILLADDHSFIRLGLIQILEDEYPGVQVKEVSDGSQLIQEVLKEDFDLVISDLDMPVVTGLEALVQVKKIKPKLPVLILSIYSEELYAVRVIKAGASGFLNKNAAPYELINAIKRIAAGGKYITSGTAENMLIEVNRQKQPHELLSNREFEIFRLLALGRSITQIAELHSLALSTVSTYRSRILEKLHLTNNAELTRYALTHEIITDKDM
jgi:DNA-binding NarL/FixJ family response regulator